MPNVRRRRSVALLLSSSFVIQSSSFLVQLTSIRRSTSHRRSTVVYERLRFVPSGNGERTCVVADESVTIEELVEYVRKCAAVPRTSISELVYVTDAGGVLRRTLTMSQLLLTWTAGGSPSLRVSAAHESLGSLPPSVDCFSPRADAAAGGLGTPTFDDQLRRFALSQTAVVDEAGRLSGGAADPPMGCGVGSAGYFAVPFWKLVAGRSSWLVSLLLMQSMSSLILSRFSSLLQRHMVIALFLTMLTGTAGNAGNQSSSTVIAGLSTGELSAAANGGRVVRREVRVAGVSGLILAAASFARVVATPGGSAPTGLAVALAMFTTVVGAVVAGSTAPFVLSAMGIDPNNGASPVLATLTDIAGVLVLCSISAKILPH